MKVFQTNLLLDKIIVFGSQGSDKIFNGNTRVGFPLTSEYYNFIQQKIRLKNFHYAMSLSKERLRIAEASHLVGKFSGLDYRP